ncbi:riboflavin biosynthesis pyrimidine reductase [Nocardioides albertanoniae]|uniref:Riboflavin biosynthesis pyrimidine reductase n=1 Tax=Nocardioides albertanoniae TaxID=1175486 RepID=A0A543A3E3_9ACTN|nr:dihydrofolate reductase family protein [Nocardioides albertanoniae]TQL66976.1 riboflavin biosynthesis pyrimidine reductase [Nocardioides albertanoniae]
MKLLCGDGDPTTSEGLRAIYAPPRLPWLRVNMVSSVDGAATGADGLSGTVNNKVDVDVFHALRDLADAVLVGAGTAIAETYQAGGTPIVVVSGRGRVPDDLRGSEPGAVRLATCSDSPGLTAARDELGAENVYVVGSSEVDLAALLARLHDEGLRHLLCEGGPTLLASLLDAGVVDELTHTITPKLLGGDGRRIVTGPPIDVPVTLASLIEQDGTLLGRWLVGR